ncbi:MAG: T9SS type A sorting domain-containing protein [Candidatus Symbiothrix sp.]|jgi:hypothetical protein|nr:T9SS type A sorting domain-containing protein [Candidatus Symbiothrix sp.]
MKAIYFLKSLAIVMLMFVVTNVTAKQIPVSGTDTDLAAALEQAETGDEILISGQILFESPVTVEKNVHFIGQGRAAAFNGQHNTKLFELVPETIEGEALTFENLGFAYGYNEDDGGVGRIANGRVEFYFCFFEGNETANRGGAFYIANADGGEEGATTVIFKGCEAVNNKATDRGGCIFVAGDANTAYEYCLIEGNSSNGPGETRGGGFFLEGGSHRFFYTLINGNTSGSPENPGGERGGAGITTAGGIKALTLESCGIINNIAYGNHGAAFFLMGTPNVTVINSTIAQNTTKDGAGSWFLPSSDIDVTLVNVSMIDNKGTNSGNSGGGIHINNDGNRINIFNSILTWNNTDNGEGAVDMGVSGFTEARVKDIVFKNSIVGLISGVPVGSVPAAQDNASIPNKSKINMYSINGEAAQPDYPVFDTSGVNYTDGLQITSSFGLPYYTLKNNGYATKLGDPALLDARDVYTDQLLVERIPATDGSIYAGSIQAIVGEDSYNDKNWEDNVMIDYGTAIKNPSALAKQDIRVIGTVSNGILGVDFGELKGQAKGDLISINGQVVEHVFDRSVIGKGYYNTHVTPGFYILKVTIEGKTFAKRLIVK